MTVQVSMPKDWHNASDVDPDQLWMDIRKGSKEALSRLFCVYYSHLFNYGFKVVPQQDFVKDSIQELFVILWSQRNKIDQAYSVKSYLFHSLRRIMLRSMTRQRNRKNRNRAYAESYYEEVCNTEELMIQFETRQEKRAWLSEAVKSLSIRQKEAVFLKVYNGMSNTEIACIMGINQQSVYNHISKAIGKLQECVKA